MADLYSFFCKLQPQENNLSIQLICVHAKKVSLISFSTVSPRSSVSQSPTVLALQNGAPTGALTRPPPTLARLLPVAVQGRADGLSRTTSLVSCFSPDAS